MENVYVELMKVAAIAKPLRDDVLNQWEEFPPQKQYTCGLLGQLLLDKTISIIEAHRGIHSDPELVMVDRFMDARIPLGKDQQNILEWMDRTDWPPGYDEEWTKTNSLGLELCQDIALFSCGCVETILQQLKLEEVRKNNPHKPKLTKMQLWRIAFDIAYSKYFQPVDNGGKPVESRYKNFDFDSLSYEENEEYEKIFDDMDEYCKELYEKETGEKYE